MVGVGVVHQMEELLELAVLAVVAMGIMVEVTLQMGLLILVAAVVELQTHYLALVAQALLFFQYQQPNTQAQPQVHQQSQPAAQIQF
jgi:hypothetical protein